MSDVGHGPEQCGASRLTTVNPSRRGGQMIVGWNRSRSRCRPAALLLAFVLAVAGGTTVQSPASAADCIGLTRVFAVDSGTGHLMELGSCPQSSALEPGVAVDSSDWRAYRQVTGVFQG